MEEMLFSQLANGMKSSKIRELMKYATSTNVISFGGGSPDGENFPFKEVQTIINNFDNKKIVQAMQYGATSGFPPLIDALKNRLNKKSNIDLNGLELTITTGGQQAIYLFSKIFIDQGDIVLVEEPSFIGAMAAFLSNGASLVGLPLDSDGVNIEKLEETLLDLRKAGKKVKFFYTIPNFQNPSGLTLSKEKRKKLYELSIKHNLLILEDDPYGELYFEGEDKDYLPIKSIGNEAPITYIGTFSKVLCPGFRIGYALANKNIIEKMELAKQSNDACSSSFGQVVAAEYLNLNLIEDYIKKMRIIYREKCYLMLSSIKESFPSSITYSKPKGGFFIYVNLGEKISANKLFGNVIKRNVAFVTGDPFHTDEKLGDSRIRLSFSSSSKEQIVSGIKIIGEEIKNL